MHLSTANSFFSVGQVYLNLREYPKALEHHLKALQIYRDINGERHPETPESFYHVAEVYRRLGDFLKAIKYNLKARDLYKFLSQVLASDDFEGKLAQVNRSLKECQKGIECNIKTYDT